MHLGGFMQLSGNVKFSASCLMQADFHGALAGFDCHKSLAGVVGIVVVNAEGQAVALSGGATPCREVHCGPVAVGTDYMGVGMAVGI